MPRTASLRSATSPSPRDKSPLLRRIFRPRMPRNIDVSSLYVTPGLVDMHGMFSGSMDREYTGELRSRPTALHFAAV